MNSREWVTTGKGQGAKGKGERRTAGLKLHAMGSLSSSELDTRLREALRELDVYENDSDWDGPYLHQVFEDHLIVEHEGQHYRHDYSVEDTEVSIETEREEVKQTWIAVNVRALRRALAAITATGHTPKRRERGDAQRTQRTTRKGGTTMREKIKTFFARILSGDATEEDLDEFVESFPEGDAPEGGGETGMEPGEGDSGLELQMAQYRKQNAELQQRVQQVEANARREKVAAQVEALVSGRHLPPAYRQHAAVLLDVLGQETKQVKLLSRNDESGEETTTEHDPAQVLVQLLEGLPTAFSADQMGNVYLVDEEKFADAGEQIEEQKSAGEALAKELNERSAAGGDTAANDG